MRILIAIGLLLIQFNISAQEKIKVISTVSIIADIASNIVGETADIETIVPIGGDPHIYEATPKDAQLVQSGDIFFINGLTFEGWIEELIDNSGTTAPSYIITEGVNTIGSTKYENSYDPHAWMDVSNVFIYAKNIKDAMVKNFPKHQAVYEKNYDKYLRELQELHKYVQEEINSIPKQQRILVTSHDAFAYYGKQYGIEVEAIVGISTEAEARSSDVLRVANVIKERKVPAIFIESTVNPKMIKQLADDNGVPVGGELFADSLGERDEEAGTYVGMIKSNTDIIVNALSKNKLSETKIDGDGSSSKLGLYIVGALFVLLLLFGILKMKN